MKKNNLLLTWVPLLFVIASGFLFTLAFRLAWNLTPVTKSIHVMSIGDGIGIFAVACILLIPVIVLAGWVLVHLLENKR